MSSTFDLNNREFLKEESEKKNDNQMLAKFVTSILTKVIFSKKEF